MFAIYGGDHDPWPLDHIYIYMFGLEVALSFFGNVAQCVSARWYDGAVWPRYCGSL